ncbi:MAG: nucleoside-diphosphate kinase, partial [Chloroflexi bacterium]|nr:nucleoside-diphosphate kinase [Chloroflexota bacterium]
GEHVGRPFFDGLVKFITSSPLMAMVVEGVQAVEAVRATMGSTDPQAAAPGTIRGDLALSIGLNLIHGSDSAKSAEREISLFFSREEVVDYSRDVDRWITEA